MAQPRKSTDVDDVQISMDGLFGPGGRGRGRGLLLATPAAATAVPGVAAAGVSGVGSGGAAVAGGGSAQAGTHVPPSGRGRGGSPLLASSSTTLLAAAGVPRSGAPVSSVAADEKSDSESETPRLPAGGGTAEPEAQDDEPFVLHVGNATPDCLACIEQV